LASIVVIHTVLSYFLEDDIEKLRRREDARPARRDDPPPRHAIRRISLMPDETSAASDIIEARAKLTQITDHLWNERTYLAYLRTGVSLMSFGIAINRFSIFLETSNRMRDAPALATRVIVSEQFGIGMVITGMVLLAWAAIHYVLVMHQIERQDFHPRSREILVLTSFVLFFGASGVIWLFTS
jgi:putative membrane protein